MRSTCGMGLDSAMQFCTTMLTYGNYAALSPRSLLRPCWTEFTGGGSVLDEGIGESSHGDMQRMRKFRHTSSPAEVSCP